MPSFPETAQFESGQILFRRKCFHTFPFQRQEIAETLHAIFSESNTVTSKARERSFALLEQSTRHDFRVL